jgi:hypothetical protein
LLAAGMDVPAVAPPTAAAVQVTPGKRDDTVEKAPTEAEGSTSGGVGALLGFGD